MLPFKDDITDLRGRVSIVSIRKNDLEGEVPRFLLPEESKKCFYIGKFYIMSKTKILRYMLGSSLEGSMYSLPHKKIQIPTNICSIAS